MNEYTALALITTLIGAIIGFAVHLLANHLSKQRMRFERYKAGYEAWIAETEAAPVQEGERAEMRLEAIETIRKEHAQARRRALGNIEPARPVQRRVSKP